MRWLPLMSALVLSSCLRSAGVSPDTLEGDKSIVFPMFSRMNGTNIGGEGNTYTLDGTTLRALMVAIHDYLPSNPRDTSCWNYPEGHRYDIIRNGKVVFIEIGTDFTHCDDPFIMFDDGAVYAISTTDDRILRRLFEGHPDYPNPLRLSPDAGGSGPQDDRDYSDLLGYSGFSKEVGLPPSWLDGGFPGRRKRSAPSSSMPDGGSRPDGGIPNDKSIVFPMFFGANGTEIGEEGKLYTMDGPTLRALMIATQDFLPPNVPGQPCWSTPEGHRYGIIRRGDIIFIEITADFSSGCWHDAMPMDYGEVYAISMDGRILRRLDPTHPDYPNPLRLSSDAGVSGPQDDRDYSDRLGYSGFGKEVGLPPSWLDGGFPGRRERNAPAPSSPDGGSHPDGGVQDDGGVPTPPAP